MNEPLRIWRSWHSKFGKLQKVTNDLLDETVTADAVYTDEELKKIADSGFNAIWVHGIINNIVSTKVFPELGKNWKTHIAKMQKLINRADKFGLKVVLYMQPPRGIHMEDSFWKNNMDIMGTKTLYQSCDDHQITQGALCTSTQKVKDFLYEASHNIVKELSSLGGIMLITASEYPSHCYTGYDYINKSGVMNCTRCRKRHPVDIVNEIIQLVRDGVRSVSKNIPIITWNWSWTLFEKDPSLTIISRLPKDVLLLCGFERGDKKNILGKIRPIDEYSLSFIGPSKRFKKSYDIARKNGIQVMTKLQIGTTHELATVPSLPLIENLYKKAKHYKKMDIKGFMGCWNFGNMISANTAAFNHFLTCRTLNSKEKTLADFAGLYFQECNKAKVTEAWKIFGQAMDNYPFCIRFLYNSCCNYSLQYPLSPTQIGKKTSGRSWLPDKRGNNLDYSFGLYTLEEIIRGLGLLAKQWKFGVDTLRDGLHTCQCRNAKKELDNAAIIYHIYRSSWNIYRAYKLRKKWSDKKMEAYLRIAVNELKNLEEVIPILKRDHEKILGFHIEGQTYMFDIAGVTRKINSLKKQLK